MSFNRLRRYKQMKHGAAREPCCPSCLSGNIKMAEYQPYDLPPIPGVSTAAGDRAVTWQNSYIRRLMELDIPCHDTIGEAADEPSPVDARGKSPTSYIREMAGLPLYRHDEQRHQ